MPDWLYKTVRGVTKRIDREYERIEIFKKMRGSKDGTFWMELDRVDAAIEEMKNNIMHLESWREVLKEKPLMPKEVNKKKFTP